MARSERVLAWLFPDEYRRGIKHGFMYGFAIGALTMLFLLSIGMWMEAVQRLEAIR